MAYGATWRPTPCATATAPRAVRMPGRGTARRPSYAVEDHAAEEDQHAGQRLSAHEAYTKRWFKPWSEARNRPARGSRSPAKR